MLNFFERLVRNMSLALASIAGIFVLLMMIQTVLGVIMDSVFGSPIKGNIEIIANYYMVFIVFMPIAIVELKHEHISADFLVHHLPYKMRRVVHAFGYFICLAFFVMLTYQSAIDAVNSWRIKEILMGDTYLPVWPAKFALPVGFFMITLAVLLHLFKALVDPDFEPAPAEPDVMSEEN